MTAQVVELGGEVNGVTSAFEAFFAEIWPDLVAFCARSTGSVELAEELTQETLTRVYVRFPLLREPRPYAFKVAGNLVRRSWRVRRVVVDGAPEALPDHDVSTIDAVRRLPDGLKEVVLLHYWADLTVAEVARLVRRPPGTVKRKLHEARAHLAVTLGGDVDD